MRTILLAASTLVASSTLLSPSGRAADAPSMAQAAPQMPAGFIDLAPQAAAAPSGAVVAPAGVQTAANPFVSAPPVPVAGPVLVPAAQPLQMPGYVPQAQAQAPAAYGVAPAPAGYPAPAYGSVPPPGYAYAPVAAQPPAAAPQTDADLAFQKALLGTMPLSEDQARQYRRRTDALSRLTASPASGVSSRPISSSVALSLHAGEASPRLSLAPGNATVLTFSDQTGASWPVMSVTVGNPTAYSAQEAGDKGKTNMVVISPLTNYASGNLVITLVGHAMPVEFSLETGNGKVDYRKDIQIEGRGPNAQYDIGEGSSLSPTNDPTMQSFVDGVAPKGAHKIHSSNAEVEAWRYKDMVYVRSEMQMLSPAWIASARHVSGVTVYTIADTPVLLFSQDGRTTFVTLGQ